MEENSKCWPCSIGLYMMGHWVHTPNPFFLFFPLFIKSSSPAGLLLFLKQATCGSPYKLCICSSFFLEQSFLEGHSDFCSNITSQGPTPELSESTVFPTFLASCVHIIYYYKYVYCWFVCWLHSNVTSIRLGSHSVFLTVIFPGLEWCLARGRHTIYKFFSVTVCWIKWKSRLLIQDHSCLISL